MVMLACSFKIKAFQKENIRISLDKFTEGRSVLHKCFFFFVKELSVQTFFSVIDTVNVCVTHLSCRGKGQR